MQLRYLSLQVGHGMSLYGPEGRVRLASRSFLFLENQLPLILTLMKWTNGFKGRELLFPTTTAVPTTQPHTRLRAYATVPPGCPNGLRPLEESEVTFSLEPFGDVILSLDVAVELQDTLNQNHKPSSSKGNFDNTYVYNVKPCWSLPKYGSAWWKLPQHDDKRFY